MDIFSRAGNMLRRPRREWPVIAAEPDGIIGLFTGYVAIVAAVPLVAELVDFTRRGVPLNAALGITLTGYCLALVDVAILAVVASALAPPFGGVASLSRGFKLASFGCTPAWLGGVFVLVPGIGGALALAAAGYGIYVCYLGVADLVLVPAGRRAGYFLIVLAVTLGIAVAAAGTAEVVAGHWAIVRVPR